MGILIAILVALTAVSCYAPALRDCTVSCEAPADCAAGQVCGSDGLCAAPEIAGSCADRPLDPPDAAMPDAAPDAPSTVTLQVEVGGGGSVLVVDHGTCNAGPPQGGKCMYDIALGVLQRVDASSIAADREFAGWTAGPCIGQPATCTFVPLLPTKIVAKFERIDD
jgi:hypothetical protein